MAGSYRHVTNSDGSFRGMDLIDNLGDAYEACEQMVEMIAYLAKMVDPQYPLVAIHQAHRWGTSGWGAGNRERESIAGYEAFWNDD